MLLLLVSLLILDTIGPWKAMHYIAHLWSVGTIELNQSPLGAISDPPGFAIKGDERVSSLRNVPCIRTLTAFPEVLCIPHITEWRLRRDP